MRSTSGPCGGSPELAANNEKNRRLLGWKAIGQYLNCTDRTAMRWENERALPVHRIPGGDRGGVWADPDELAAWLRAVPPEESQAPEPSAAAAPPTSGSMSPGAEPPLAPAQPPPAAESISPSPRVWPGHWRSRRWWSAAAAGLIGAFALAGIGANEHWWSLPHATGASTPYDDDPQARELYLTSRLEFNTRTASSLKAAEQGFGQLTGRYPDRAPGWSGLADTYILLREFGAMTDEEAFTHAARAAHTALALDPKLAEAWIAQGYVAFWKNGDADGAFQSFETALRLDPSSVRGWHWYATSLYAHGEFARALEAIARARTMDPDNRAIVADEAVIRFSGGERAQGLATLEHLEELDPSFMSTHAYLAYAYVVLGRDADFLREALITARERGQADVVAGLEAARKRLEDGGRQAMLEQLTANEAAGIERGTGCAAFAAWYRALAGDRDGMLKWLAVSESRHEPKLMVLRWAAGFAPYQTDPAVQAILARAP